MRLILLRHLKLMVHCTLVEVSTLQAPHAPNISLNAAGSINALEGAFTGDTIVPLRVGDPARDKDHGIRIAKNQADVPIYGDIYLTNDGLTFGTGVSTSSIRDANELVQIKNGNVKIGGTLPSAPNISLNASGSATFAGDLFISTLDGGDGTKSEQLYIKPAKSTLRFQNQQDPTKMFSGCTQEMKSRPA